ncbi:LacI family transcriptional regulator [Pantoea rwandensis]|uniref:LacI family transcriptional regulator n=2 Tax=Pantoea rwandensis TaxID=1076550 RepID=A0A1X1D3J9_9GAMM|nr:LacI family transcriptional regulator [Pantoea rwandensis]
MANKLDKRTRATATDVAQKAGVSKWTVSRAFTPGASISDKAREDVLAAAKELGYRPNLLARSLSQKRTHIIGVVVDELKNPHSMMMLDEVTRQLQSRGYMALMLNITGENYRSVMSLAEQLQVDGILFLGTALTPEFVAIANDLHKVPLVQVSRNIGGKGIDVVNIDGYRAGKVIARLLLEQGHQRFGYMAGPGGEEGHLQRKMGYVDELKAHGHELDLELETEHYDRMLGYQAMQRYLLEMPVSQRVDALFCENDILALGAMAALRDISPEIQLALVGFDDIEESEIPGCDLTSYSQRLDRLMHEAICRLIDGKGSEKSGWEQGEIRIRRSHLKH